MRILEYRPNFGTFSAGFENIGDNEVTEVVQLSKDAVYGYNRIHKQWFPSSLESISTFRVEDSVDLAIFNPSFGGKVGRKGRSNFFFYDFQDCLNFLGNNEPRFVVFQTEVDVIPYLNVGGYVRDGFGQVSRDRLVEKLWGLGYKPYLVVLDEADYGVPLHRSFAFYVGTPLDFDFVLPGGFYSASGRGGYRRFRSVCDAIGDLGVMGDWVEYGVEAQNVFQLAMRCDQRRVTWHHAPKIKKSQKEKIASIRQGSNNDTPVARGRSKGYNRAKWDSICRCMDDQFYLTSSKQGDSIHPIENRPFSIREGCRIHGLPDNLSFDMKVPRKSLATMIHNSVAPVIGEIFAIALDDGPGEN